MRVLPVEVAADDGIELVELLCLVADLCDFCPTLMGDVLAYHLGAGYSAEDLRMDSARLADRLALAMGFADASLEPLR